MNLVQRLAVIKTMDWIVIKAGKLRKADDVPQVELDIIGGYLAIYNLALNTPELLTPIGNIQRHRNAGLYAYQAYERARIMSENPEVTTSSVWGKERIGAIRPSNLILSFSSPLPDVIVEACVIALGWHMEPAQIGQNLLDQVLRGQSPIKLFIREFIEATKPLKFQL